MEDYKNLLILFCFTHLQVLADQAIWAVCGRAAAVVDMSSVPKQTVAVEVMPLVGGHLRLPKVRVSRYVEGGAAAAGRPSAANINAGESTELHSLKVGWYNLRS